MTPIPPNSSTNSVPAKISGNDNMARSIQLLASALRIAQAREKLKTSQSNLKSVTLSNEQNLWQNIGIG